MQEVLVVWCLIGFLLGKHLYEIVMLKRFENKKLAYRISDHMSDKPLQTEPPPSTYAEGLTRAFVGISPFALSLVFEFYEDLDKEETKKFLSEVLFEFIKDLQEHKEEVRRLARTKFVVEYTQSLGVLRKCVILSRKWLYIDISQDYIDWLTKTYGIKEDEIMNIAVVYHMLKTRGKRVIVKLSSCLDAMVCTPY
jgi:hypothetical protein